MMKVLGLSIWGKMHIFSTAVTTLHPFAQCSLTSVLTQIPISLSWIPATTLLSRADSSSNI